MIRSAMRRFLFRAKASAFTLIEALAVIAILAVLAAILLPVLSNSDRTDRAGCSNNLRQVCLGFIMRAMDNGGSFPMQSELIATSEASALFQMLSKHHGNSPDVFLCPTDKARSPAASINAMSGRNLSYFLNLDATTNNSTSSIIAGDRHLQTNGQALKPGLFVLTTNVIVGWTAELHAIKNRRPFGGNIAFADGHVEWSDANPWSSRSLPALVQRQPLTERRFVVP